MVAGHGDGDNSFSDQLTKVVGKVEQPASNLIEH